MKDLLHSARALLSDLASTLLFFAVYALSGSIVLSVAAGMVLVIGQIGWQFLHRKPVDTLQWISLVVVMASGAATLFAHNPVYTMLQPSVIYLLVGTAMLRRGWMRRYLPAIAITLLPDLVIGFGTVWAGLMFFSAALNLGLALTCNVLTWGALMSIWGTVSKIALFFIQYGVMKSVGMRRRHSQLDQLTGLETAPISAT